MSIMERYTIIVTVEHESQGAAFTFVEQAIERELDNHAYLHGQKGKPESVHVATPDGTKATEF
jgi:hypothetical protein